MKKLAAILLTPIAVLAVLPGCRAQPAAPDLEIRPAPIHEVSVSWAKSKPPQAVVYIKGGLSDGCTTFNEAKVTGRSGSRITISVTTKRPKNAICTQVYGYFEEDVNLGSDFVSSQTYTVAVNDTTATFVAP